MHVNRNKFLAGLLCLLVLAGAAWVGSRSWGDKKPEHPWTEVVPGVFRSPGSPAGYALVAGDNALLIDAPRSLAEVKAQGIKNIDALYLTHHHRDSCAFAPEYAKANIPV